MMGSSRSITICLCMALVLAIAPRLRAADGGSGSNIAFDAAKAGPRTVEALTGQRIVHDYAAAWGNLINAFDSSAPELIGAYFAGPANDSLVSAIGDQKKTGLHSRYLSPSHKLEVVFYAPEGDVMELHDTVVCDFQLMDGANVIHDEHATLYYVVLMTPAADRWVIRQFQAVPGF